MIGKPFSFRENTTQGFVIHYEMVGCNFVETIENDDSKALFAAIADIFNEGVTDIYIERATFKKERIK